MNKYDPIFFAISVSVVLFVKFLMGRNVMEEDTLPFDFLQSLVLLKYIAL